MFLALNVGNTHINLGLFHGERLRCRWRLNAVAARSEDEYWLQLSGLLGDEGVQPAELKGAMICSVIPRLTRTLQWVLTERCGMEARVLDHSLDLGFENRYRHPENVGPDRLANVLAGIERYGAPLIVVDSGTATTFDVVSPDRAYLGGVILPGLEMSADSLFQKTSLLPRVSVEAPLTVIGSDTLSAINSGLVHGTAGAVDHLVTRIREEIGAPQTPAIATGGHAKLLAETCATLREAAPDLTLEGIRHAWLRQGSDNASAGGSRSR